jgi:hypothetical protein
VLRNFLEPVRPHQGDYHRAPAGVHSEWNVSVTPRAFLHYIGTCCKMFLEPVHARVHSDDTVTISCAYSFCIAQRLIHIAAKGLRSPRRQCRGLHCLDAHVQAAVILYSGRHSIVNANHVTAQVAFPRLVFEAFHLQHCVALMFRQRASRLHLEVHCQWTIPVLHRLDSARSINLIPASFSVYAAVERLLHS